MTADVGKANSGVSFQTVEAHSLYWRVGEFSLERFSGQAKNLVQADLRPVGIESELLIPAYGRIFLIGAGKDTFVTAEQPVTYFFS